MSTWVCLYLLGLLVYLAGSVQVLDLEADAEEAATCRALRKKTERTRYISKRTQTQQHKGLSVHLLGKAVAAAGICKLPARNSEAKAVSSKRHERVSWALCGTWSKRTLSASRRRIDLAGNPGRPLLVSS